MTKITKVQNRSTKGDEVVAAIPAACADEKAAVEFMEKQRWGEHVACPRCGSLSVYQMTSTKKPGRQENYRWRCRDCAGLKLKDQFTVRTGTVFEDSRIELRHWCYAFWRASTSKKGVSALEIHRQTGLSYKSSLFLLHRIRYAMDDGAEDLLKGDVEVDEVYLGQRPRHYHKSLKTKVSQKTAVVGLFERGGRIRPRIVANVSGPVLKDLIRKNVDKSARILTDESNVYYGLGKEFAGGHETVHHGAFEYVRGDVTTNGIEGFFATMRRGLDGIYHSVSRKHLHRYLSEFQFRHDHRHLDDGDRTVAAIKAANNKRLTYSQQIETNG